LGLFIQNAPGILISVQLNTQTPMTKLALLKLPSLILLSFAFNAQTLNVPKTKKMPVPIKYCKDTTLIDNYRWLENLHDTLVKQWFNQQGCCFNELASRISGRNGLFEELENMDRMKSEGISKIQFKNNCYFFLKTLPGEGIGKLFMRQGKTGTDLLLFDPTHYLKDQVFTIRFFLPCEDASKIAFGIAQGGSELAKILILDTKTKSLFQESIYPCCYGIYDWTDNNSSFYYTAHRVINRESSDFSMDTKLMVHRIGTDPSLDVELFSHLHNPELAISKADIIAGFYSSDRKYLLVNLASVATDKDIFYTPISSLSSSIIPWKHLFSKEDNIIDFAFANDSIYMVTHKHAPNFRITVTSSKNPDLTKARVLLPEDDQTIKSISRSEHFLLIEKTTGTKCYTLRYNFKTGTTDEIIAPEKGSVEVTSLGITSDECLLSLTSYIKPTKLYDLNLLTKSCTKSFLDRSITYPYMDDMIENEVEVKSPDGENISLSLVYPKGLQFDGSTYCILEAYGAYGRPSLPYLTLQRMMLIHHGIVYAYAHVRGGGEKGDAWHKAGMKKTKPNSWNDFIACAEYLVQKKFTSSSKLIAEGGSAGGIVIGRAITARPELFGAAVIISGEMNPLLGEFEPSGPANIPEFGTVKNQDECISLIEMDPLYHVIDGVKYPALICIVGMNDPRVVPWSQAKFVGALQNASTSGKAVMLRVAYDSGHSTEDKNAYFKEVSDRYAFALWALGHPDFQLTK
jgi:prolyl oligopeptidase